MILYASTPTFAASETSGRMAWWWFYLFPESPARLFEIVHLLSRKMAHVTEYAILTLGWLVAGQVHLGRLPPWAWLWAGTWGLSVASLDEWRQSQWLSRTGTWHDVVVDLVGVGLALWVFHWFRFHSTSRRHQSLSPPTGKNSVTVTEEASTDIW